MTEIIIYTTPVCPYCVKAKDLLKRKGQSVFNEIDVSKSDEARESMMSKSVGRRSVPQIFINGKHIGGCDDLYELESKGELDKILNS